MKMRKQKKQIPADFRKQMYGIYKANMTLYGKPILPYKQWLKDVFNIMKKIIIISIAPLALTACESKQAEEVKASSNQSYPVEKLFTVDGITVYRFSDNDRYVYFTNRTGDVQYSYQERVGKATKTIRVQTVCNDEQEFKNQ